MVFLEESYPITDTCVVGGARRLKNITGSRSGSPADGMGWGGGDHDLHSFSHGQGSPSSWGKATRNVTVRQGDRTGPAAGKSGFIKGTRWERHAHAL